MSSKIGHAQKVYMSSKIDLKSRTLFGLGTDRRILDFLSYFKTLSLGRMNSSFALDRHEDKTLFFEHSLNTLYLKKERNIRFTKLHVLQIATMLI